MNCHPFMHKVIDNTFVYIKALNNATIVLIKAKLQHKKNCSQHKKKRLIHGRYNVGYEIGIGDGWGPSYGA